MLRPLRLLNLALGLVAVMLAAALAKTWVAAPALVPAPPESKQTQEAPVLAAAPTVRPPLAHFDVLLQKNPFKQPPPPPPPRLAAPVPGPPPPPPAPLPTLVGTILAGDERRAVLSDKGKANIYSIGQEVAGGTVTSISEDRVVFKRGEVVSEITLKALIQQGSSPAAPAPAAASMPPPPPPSAPTPVPAQAIEGAPAPPAEAQGRTERRRPRLLRQPGQVVPTPPQQEEE